MMLGLLLYYLFKLVSFNFYKQFFNNSYLLVKNCLASMLSRFKAKSWVKIFNYKFKDENSFEAASDQSEAASKLNSGLIFIVYF